MLSEDIVVTLLPPKRTYIEIMEDLNNSSEEFKKTMLYKRLVMAAEMIREAEEKLLKHDKI